MDSPLDHNSSIASQNLKRPWSVEEDNDTVSVASAPKQSCYAVNHVPKDQLQLATYTLECLLVSSQKYATGIFINSWKVTLLYFDHSVVMCTVTFDFGKDNGPVQLALTLYALSQCNVGHAYFNPYLHQIELPEDKDAVIPESAIKPLKEPSFNLSNTCLMFPQPGDTKSRWFFLLCKLIEVCFDKVPWYIEHLQDA